MSVDTSSKWWVSSVIKKNDESFCKRLEGKVSVQKNWVAFCVRLCVCLCKYSFWLFVALHRKCASYYFYFFSLSQCFDGKAARLAICVKFRLLHKLAFDKFFWDNSIFFFRFISSNIFLQSLPQSACLFGLCCIVHGSMIFTLSVFSRPNTHKE